MKVSKAISLLSQLNPDDEIIMELWDVDCFHGNISDENGDDVPLIPQNVWNDFVSGFTVRDNALESVNEDINWALQEYWNSLVKEVK